MSHPFDDVKSVRISHSTLKLFRSCPRKFEFRKLYLYPKKDTSLPAEVGKCLHTGFQHFIMHGDRERAQFAMMLDYPYEVFRESEAADKNTRNVFACYATLELMMNMGGFDEWEVATIFDHEGKERDAIEVPFSIEIENFSLSDDRHIPITYVGKIDAILFNRRTQEYRVVDIKTHRQNLNDMSGEYAYDDQCLSYGLVLERLLGKPIGTLDVTYYSCYIDLISPKVLPYTFSKTTDMIEDWGRGMYLDLINMKFGFIQQWYARKPQACMAFNRKCSFFDLCASRDHHAIQQMVLMGAEETGFLKETDFDTPWVNMKLDLGLAA